MLQRKTGSATANPVPRPGTTQVRIRAAALTAIGSFSAVLGAIEAMALRGQVDFGHHVLHLRGIWLAVPPVALEGGTLAAATLTLWAVLAGDSAALPRLMTAVLICAAGYANSQGAKQAHRPTLAADYLAGASVASYLMWHSILTRIRRSELRQAGAIEVPLPRFRLLRWLLAFAETYTAFKVAIREGVTSTEDALALARREATPPPARSRQEIPDEELIALAGERGGKRRAVEYAAIMLGTDEAARAQQWLADRGIDVDHSYVSRTLSRMVNDRRHPLIAVED